MNGRIGAVCAALPRADVFADIGCDHGYMTHYMLRNGLCRKAYISDVSSKSLGKAEKLLSRYISAGTCIPVVADGLEGLPEPCDLVLIAGLGGEEIVKILEKSALPARFVLQPMRSSEKLRRFLAERGAHLERDFTFAAENARRTYYYDLIAGSANGGDGGDGGDGYSEREFRFGRDNLRGESRAFLRRTEEELEKTRSRLTLAQSGASREALEARKTELERILCEIPDRRRGKDS